MQNKNFSLFPLHIGTELRFLIIEKNMPLHIPFLPLIVIINSWSITNYTNFKYIITIFQLV